MTLSRLTWTAFGVIAAATACRSFTPLEPVSARGGRGALDSTQTVLGHPQGVLTGTIPLSGEPYGVAISGSGEVFIARVYADSVSHTPVSSPAFGTAIPLDSGVSGDSSSSSQPWMGSVHVAFTPDGAKAYVTDQFGNAVSVIDVASHTVSKVVPLGDGGFNIAVSPDGFHAYATTAGGMVEVISTATDEVVTTMHVGSAANGLAFTPDGATLFISSRDAGTVTAFRTSDNTVTATYTVGGRPQRLAVSPDGANLYAANEDSGMSVVSLTGGGVQPAVHGVLSGYGLAMTPDGAQVWVTDPSSGTLYIVDRSSLTVTSARALGAGVVPRNVAFTADGRGAVVTDGNGSVLFFK